MKRRTRSVSFRFCIVLFLLTLILSASPSTSHSGDHSRFSHIEDTNPNPAPHYLSPEDEAYIEALIEQRLKRGPIIAAPPVGDIWTLSEYDPVYGVLVGWESGQFLSLLAEFVYAETHLTGTHRRT